MDKDDTSPIREREIAKAAETYNDKHPVAYMSVLNAFTAGAKWADSNPLKQEKSVIDTIYNALSLIDVEHITRDEAVILRTLLNSHAEFLTRILFPKC